MEKNTALNHALKLLSLRDRSTHELTEALKNKGCGNSDTCDAIERLKKNDWLNDLRFAKTLAASRIKNKGYGRRRIDGELKKRGIAKEIIAAALSDIDEISEKNAAKTAFEKWLKKNNALTKNNGRLAWAHLVRRGFAYSLIREVIKNFTECGESIREDGSEEME